MANLTVDFSTVCGAVKPMHCVNNGPIPGRPSGQTRSNLAEYKAAGIPFARNHDAAFYSGYGGEHTVDVAFIFPDFSRDPEDETAYDFAMTDKYVADTFLAGTETFYRLGAKIEHGVKKYNIHPPADFSKWARICEHIIRHYNEGWADGFRYDLKYWEIWNEPDLDAEPGRTNFRCWSGTPEQFYELYDVTAKHLKACFPDIKVGGPALAHHVGEWLDNFIGYVKEHNSPLDFCSWHIYSTDVHKVVERHQIVRSKLDAAGFTGTESILNEYNYVKGWTELFIYSIRQIIGIKGAAFTAGCMCGCQNAGLDMLMYYDARPTPFNGIFDYYTLEPLKGYYPFAAFNSLYRLGKHYTSTSDDGDIFVTAAGDGKDGRAVMIVYYTDDDKAKSRGVTLSGDDFSKYSFRLLDKHLDLEEISIAADADGSIQIELLPNSVLLAEKK
ncbi:MAG: hypothetical protein IKD29_04905 [Lentisphaeria bacterium]|nr:hypothetical protein [Lentisphaeria bacterium]